MTTRVVDAFASGGQPAGACGFDPIADSLYLVRRALEASAENWRAHYNLADALEDLGETRDARPHWREYLRFDRESEQAAYALQRIGIRSAEK